jgi:hypothetical protein
MDYTPDKYFALLANDTNKVLELVMSPNKPDVSYVDNFMEAIEITEQTFYELAYGSDKVKE